MLKFFGNTLEMSTYWRSLSEHYSLCGIRSEMIHQLQLQISFSSHSTAEIKALQLLRILRIQATGNHTGTLRPVLHMN
jgi:hypothetical protein